MEIIINDSKMIVAQFKPDTYNVLSLGNYNKAIEKIKICLAKKESQKLILDFSKVNCFQDINVGYITCSLLEILKIVDGRAIVIASKYLENFFLLVLLNLHRKFLTFDVCQDMQSAVCGLNTGKRQRQLPKGVWKTFFYRWKLINSL